MAVDSTLTECGTLRPEIRYRWTGPWQIVGRGVRVERWERKYLHGEFTFTAIGPRVERRSR